MPKIPVIAVEGAVLFPGAVAALEPASRSEGGPTKGQEVVVVLRDENGELKELGVLARVDHVDSEGALVTGLRRVRLSSVDDGGAEIEEVATAEATGTEIAALALEARKLAREILSMLQGVPPRVLAAIEAERDAGRLADQLAHRVPAETPEKQRVLETLDVRDRLTLVVAMLARRLEQLEVARGIEENVQDEMGRAQREHLLRKRLAAIQKELGEGPPSDDDVDQALADRLAAAGLPAELKAQVDKELARLRKLPESSPERSVARTWLQWIADLPWSTSTTDNLDLENARATLDGDHHGLEKVKRRVLQFLAVRKLKNDLRGPILAFAGPPGVGKTSLGKSIARALGRKFVRVSLGGVRDEAELRGHRRTYVGALPGRIVQAMKRAGTVNPVILLDEVDKLGGGTHGDPSAALLEVLDPAQNHAFVDHYLEVPLDLSKVLFIATANTLETIPPPLLDRMEVLELPSYTLPEKVAIARGHLVPKQLEANGLATGEARVTDAALERIALSHTREAGVRSLERRIGDVARAVAVEKASGSLAAGRVVDAAEIETLLGPDRYEPALRDTSGEPGVATGLAFTPMGGEVLQIETLRMPGRGQVILSGQLGDVMRESAKAALSYAQANAAALGLADRPLEGQDLHVHVPAGAVPKDGPSAGVTMLTAIVSQLSGVPVRTDTAMTGEITLRGRVLPVGGIKEKLLAAHRSGVRRVILPRDSQGDLRELPADVRADLELVLVTRMDEVLDAALDRPAPALRAAA